MALLRRWSLKQVSLYYEIGHQVMYLHKYLIIVFSTVQKSCVETQEHQQMEQRLEVTISLESQYHLNAILDMLFVDL